MPLPPETLRFSRPLTGVEAQQDTVPAAVEKRVQQRLQNYFEAGRAEGERTLHMQLVQQRTEVAQLQNGVLNSIQQVVPQLLRECEKHLAELAVEVARKLVSNLPVDQPMIEAAVKEATLQLEHACSYTVTLNPEDLDLLNRMHADILQQPADGAGHKVSFRPSPDVPRGGCLLESPFGTIDNRRETRLEQVRKAVFN